MEQISRTYVMAFVFFFLLSLVLTWPLTANLDQFLSTSSITKTDANDVKAHLDFLEYVTEQFENGDNFFVVRPNFDIAYTYMFPGMVAISIFDFSTIGWDSFYFLISMTLTGFTMYLFAYELSSNQFLSLTSGLFYMGSPRLLWEYSLGHTNHWQMQWIPLTFYLTERTITSKKPKTAIFLGISLALVVLTSTQFSLYFSFLLPIYVLLRYIYDRLKPSMTDIKNLGLALLTSVSLSSFYLYKRMFLYYSDSLTRTIIENSPPRATLLEPSFLFPPLGSLVFVKERSFFSLLLFIFLFLLLTVGIIILFRMDDVRRYIPLLAITGISAFSMLGIWTRFSLHYWLYHYWPLMDRFRHPLRMYPFYLMGTALISGITLLKFKELLPRSFKQRKSRIVLLLIFSAVFVVLYRLHMQPHVA